MSNLKPDWTVGFTDGEGSFPISLQSDRCRFKILFEISQKEKLIIETIRMAFGFGRIGYNKKTSCYQFIVSDLESLRKIRDFFIKHPLQTVVKQKDFEIWCQVLGIIERGEHYSKEGILKIARLRDSISTYKKKRRNPQYLNYEQIKSLLGDGARSMKNYRWTEEEEQRLKDNLHLLDEELANLLKRTPNGIISRRRKLGLKKRNGLSGKWLVRRRFRNRGDKNG